MQKNKALILFLVKFFVSYFVMLGVYNFYQNKTQQRTSEFKCSPITSTVAKQSRDLINFFGYKGEVMQHESELSYKVLVNDAYVARVIEGCNSMSVIILFIAFIIAFSGKFITTFLYALIGSFLIYLLNILRIALLAIGLYKYPEKEGLFHDLLFPSVIYGFIVIMWLLWIKKYALIHKK